MNIKLLTALVLTLVVESYCNDCLTQSCLTDLYNSNVRYAEYYTRPLSSGSSSGKKRFIESLDWGLFHAGVVVTVTNGDRWLIHKGKDYGDSSSTVITDAGYMSSEWNRKYQSCVRGHIVNDFMVAAKINEHYDAIFGPNCQTAAKGMWQLVGC